MYGPVNMAISIVVIDGHIIDALGALRHLWQLGAHVQLLDCTEGADVGGASEDYRTEVSSRAVIAERLLRAGRRLWEVLTWLYECTSVNM